MALHVSPAPHVVASRRRLASSARRLASSPRAGGRVTVATQPVMRAGHPPRFGPATAWFAGGMTDSTQALRQPLRGKAAVVTGGSRGIGRAIVERLARDGAEVVFGYLANSAAAGEVERAVAAGGGRAGGFQADLGEPGGVQKLLKYAMDQLGGLDILVNNAAARFTPTPIADVGENAYERVLAV